AVRPQQIDRLRQSRWKRVAVAIARLKENPATAIGSIQVCITMTNLLLGSIGEPAMSKLLLRLLGPLSGLLPPALFHTVSLVLSFVTVTLLTVVFSELLPKAMTLRYVTAAAILTAVPVVMISRITQPLVWVMNAMANTVTRPLGLGTVDDFENEIVTVGELRSIATQAREQGVLTDRAQSLVLNSIALAQRRAKDVMVPRTRVAHLDLRLSMDENRAVINSQLYSRLPLCDGGMDRVIGVVSTKEFLSAFHEAGDVQVLSLIAQRPVFVPSLVMLDRLLAVLHENQTQMVVLVDEYGGVEGLVTLQDVVDELVGHIKERSVRTVASDQSGTVAENHFIIAGNTPLHDVGRLLNRPEWGNGQPVSTVGGLVTLHLDRFPEPGDEVEVEGVMLHVRSAHRTAREIEVWACTPDTTDTTQ
ncbi:MAG TPA: hemolysin family protein, partial [Tepidisphaeraceae bacterium]